MRKILTLILFLVSLSFSEIVSGIKIEGTKYTPDSLIFGLLKLKPGMEFSRFLLSEDIKRLYSTGFFKQIAVKENKKDDHVELIYIIQDLPIIYKIEFKGNKEISSSEIYKKLGIEEEVGKISSSEATQGIPSTSSLNTKLAIIKHVKLGRVFSEEEIHAIEERIKQLYEEGGYNGVTITHKIVPVKGASKLIFYIHETKPEYVGDITFHGNKHFSSGRLLDHMKTQPMSIIFFRWHPPFSKEVLKEDLQRLKRFYENHGFFDVEIKKPIIKKSGDRYNITINIKEGPRYKISDLEIKHNKMFSYKELVDSIIKNNKEVYYNKDIIRKIIKRINKKYGEIGYINEEAVSKIKPDYKTKTVKVVIDVYEGGPVYLSKLHIRGNYETRDYVIRREMRVREYDLITRHELELSKERIMNLGYYDDVEMRTVPKGADFADLFTKVKERFTGQFSVGVGYNQVTGVAGFVSLRKGNFLGTGDIAGISASLGTSYANDTLSYTHKWLFNKPIDVTNSIYDTKINYVDYNVSRIGYDLTFTRQYGEYWYVTAGSSIQKITYSNISSSAPLFIQQEAGTYQARKLIFSVDRNTTDYYLFPSRGMNTELSYQIALKVLGGNEKFQKITFSNANYIKDPFFHTGTILSARETFGIAQGYGGGIVPLDDKFFVGGDYSIRGYSYGYAGPLDSAGEPIGANKEFFLNFEADYPIYKRIFYVDAFFDTGRGADSFNGLRPSNWVGSYGFGIRFITSFAPVRLDLAFKTKPVPGDTSRTRVVFILGSFF